MNPYHVLEVRPHADLAEIRASYRRLVRLHHPDCARDEAARVTASERMVEINWAWHIVSDATRRAVFDARLQVEQIELERRHQEALRAQKSPKSDVLKSQPSKRGSNPNPSKRPATAANSAPNSAQQKARELKRIEQLERERREHARQMLMPPARRQAKAQERRARRQERAQLHRTQRADQKGSSHASARRQLAEAARLFRHEGRAGEAIAICQGVLRVDFRNVPARELLGDFYLQLGREDRTLPLWEQALALQPNNVAVRRKLNSLCPREPVFTPLSPSAPDSAPQKERAATENIGFWGRLVHAFRSGL